MDTRSQNGTFGDYLRLVRDHRVVIGLMVLLCAGAALIISLAQQPRYRASVSLQFQSQTEDLARAGAPSTLTSTAEELAAQGAETAVRTDALEGAKSSLNSRKDVDELRRSVTATVDADSHLVKIEATAGSARAAADLANAVAQQAVRSQTTAERGRFRQAAARVERELRTTSRKLPAGSVDRASALDSFYDRLASLRTLSVNASPVSVVSSAAVPASPFAPKPLQNTAFGALVGLLLGLVIGFIRESLDRRLRDGDQIRDLLGRPVVTMVREEAFGRTPFIDGAVGQMAEQDLESFRILRANLAFLDVDTELRTIAVTSPLPEEGKSTIAAALALASAASGKQTMLLECDLRRPSLAARLHARPKPGLADLLTGLASEGEVLQHVRFAEGAPVEVNTAGAGVAESGASATTSPTLDYIAAGSHAMLPAEVLASDRYQALVASLAQRYETVILDTAPLLSVADAREVLPLVDGVLLCVRIDKTTRDQALAGAAALSRLPERPTGLVITGLQKGREADYGYYSAAYERYAPAGRGA